jgi:hypothetical protein
MLRCLLVIGLVCGLSGIAKADDFQMVVVDPPPSFTFFDITSLGTPFTASWSACAPGELPSGTTGYVGCISFLNGTGVTLTNLELIIPDTGGIVGQTANCAIDPNNIFSNLNCPADPVNGNFILNFSGGSIAPSEFFVIAEIGADPSAFPDVTAIVSPEPSSALLLSTGILSIGLFAAYRRRDLLCESRQSR